MDLKSLIKNKGESKPQRIILMGDSGVGKTSFAACFPKPLFVQPRGEEGISTLIANGTVKGTDYLPACDSWATLREYTRAAVDTDHKTVVFDGLGSIEELLHKHVCDDKFNGDMGPQGFQSFMTGFKASIPYLREWLGELDDLRESGKGVLVLAHSARRTFKNPGGADYGKIMLDVHDRTGEAVKRWADMMLYYTFEVTTSKDGLQTKARDAARVLYTQPEAAHDAKNRYTGLEPVIDAGESHTELFQNFADAIKKARGGK